MLAVSTYGRKMYLKRTKEYLEYLFFLLQKGTISLIPFRLLYLYSDVWAFIFHFIIRYRLDIVRKNLRMSFPSKNEKELKRIARSFYRNLTDVTIESIKGYSIKPARLQKRYTFKNIEVANRYYAENRNIILALSHYGNWEWGTVVAGHVFMHDLYALYKPMSNKFVDSYISSLRNREGMKLIRTDRPWFLSHSLNGHPSAFFFISDQNPGVNSRVVRTTFLNQETACSRGIEVYARQFDMPVIFVHVHRIRRGHYSIELEEIATEPNHILPGEITKRYMRCLEKQIINKPEDWLWSHRRWKRTEN